MVLKEAEDFKIKQCLENEIAEEEKSADFYKEDYSQYAVDESDETATILEYKHGAVERDYNSTRPLFFITKIDLLELIITGFSKNLW